RGAVAPFGGGGGGAGARTHSWVRRGEQPIEPSPLPGKVGSFPLEPGDVVVMETSGGGGFGDALDRDSARLAADLAQGYVTSTAAEASYGVVLAGGGVDAAGTAARRAVLRAM